MSKGTSIYLDAVRFLAACVVFVSHASGHRFSDGLLWQVGPYGLEAVDVFFVLSGFVIAYVVDGHESTPVTYAVSRAARIYSVAIPALAATLILDDIGRTIDPFMYNASWGYVWPGRASQFLHALFFLNQAWFNNIPPGSDLPYWSLGYEVWYYVIFGVAIFAPHRWRVGAVVVLLTLAGPKIAALFPTWLLGAAAYRLCTRRTLPPFIGAALCLGSLAAWIGYEAYVWRFGRPIAPNWIGRPEIIQDYIVSILFALHLIGFGFISQVVEPAFSAVERPIRWAAGATLTLYLFHLPLAQFLITITPWPSSAWSTRVLVFGGVLFLVFLIAEVTERKKAVWRRGFAWAAHMVEMPLSR